jgi:mRNA interferase MazF
METPDAKSRPAVVLVRNEAIDLLTSITVAPLTRTRRGIPSEIELGSDEGIGVECVATFDNLVTVPRSFLTRQIGAVNRARWPEVCAAMRAAIAC